jgi:DNA-binding IclR family transcriptional regulator
MIQYERGNALEVSFGAFAVYHCFESPDGTSSKMTDMPQETNTFNVEQSEVSVRRQTSADKTLTILMALGELGLKNGGSVRLADLVQHAGYPRPTVHRLLTELKRFGFAEQEEATGRYRLGPKILLLSAQCLGGLDLRQAAQPILRKLVDEIGHTSHLGVLDGHKITYIDKVESWEGVRLASTLGQQRIASATSLGKIILAFSATAIVDNYLREPLPRQTANSITTPDDFRKELDKARGAGIAFDLEECEPGIRCVAAPIFDHNGSAIAAISVSTLASLVSLDELQELGKKVAAAAEAITRSIRGRFP